MKPGSVIVDLAAETGGNCALTKPGRSHRDAERRDRHRHHQLAVDHAVSRKPTVLAQRLRVASRRSSKTARSCSTPMTISSKAPASLATAPHSFGGSLVTDVSHLISLLTVLVLGGLCRIRGHLESTDDAAHAADVGDQRDSRHRDRGRDGRHRIARSMPATIRSRSTWSRPRR